MIRNGSPGSPVLVISGAPSNHTFWLIGEKCTLWEIVSHVNNVVNI